ncbi:MAG TPA: T9SS type A sorting domain-containing protein, partial [Flavobacterium sp.]|nr:T9SS type A sorting domain-containing protein [Flavobacterium sp.]
LSAEQWAANSISKPYPNPAQEIVNVKLGQIQGPIHVTISNLLGQTLYRNTLQSSGGILTIGLASNWNGTLLMTFEGEFGKVTRKVVRL